MTVLPSPRLPYFKAARRPQSLDYDRIAWSGGCWLLAADQVPRYGWCLMDGGGRQLEAARLPQSVILAAPHLRLQTLRHVIRYPAPSPLPHSLSALDGTQDPHPNLSLILIRTFR